MGDDNTKQKRKFKWNASYSNITAKEAAQRLGFTLESVKAITVEEMLADAGYRVEGVGVDAIKETKEKVYGRILEYIRVEGYPSEDDPDFKEANINHLVYAIIIPIVDDFICRTGRESTQLRWGKVIVSTDDETEDTEEFVVVNMISVEEEKFFFIVGAMSTSFGKATRQLLLAMKDIRDNNCEGKVYGFVTIGERWRMVEYDGTSFRKTDMITVVFDTMDRRKELWMKESSIVVDCINVALSNGGMVG